MTQCKPTRVSSPLVLLSLALGMKLAGASSLSCRNDTVQAIGASALPSRLKSLDATLHHPFSLFRPFGLDNPAPNR